TRGLDAVRRAVENVKVKVLPFHYRIAPEVCEVADRILQPLGGDTLLSTCHYSGPKPGRVTVAREALSKEEQIRKTAQKLKEQIRVCGGLIREGDLLGVIGGRKDGRDYVWEAFEQDPLLHGRSKVIRAREGSDDDYDPSFDAAAPICILT